MEDNEMSINDDFLLISKSFQENLYMCDLERIRKEFSEFAGQRKKYILNLCDRVVDQKSLTLKENEEIRVSIIKLIVAAFPDSLGHIQKLLKKEYTREEYELLFTVFCFVDNLLHFPCSEKISKCTLSFVREFMLTVKHKSNNAAWMAGDLLGAHWNLQASLPVLFEVSQRASYVAGREAAINGLAEAFKRTKSNHKRKNIINLLREINENDESKNVRLSAQLILMQCK